MKTLLVSLLACLGSSFPFPLLRRGEGRGEGKCSTARQRKTAAASPITWTTTWQALEVSGDSRVTPLPVRHRVWATIVRRP